MDVYIYTAGSRLSYLHSGFRPVGLGISGIGISSPGTPNMPPGIDPPPGPGFDPPNGPGVDLPPGPGIDNPPGPDITPKTDPGIDPPTGPGVTPPAGPGTSLPGDADLQAARDGAPAFHGSGEHFNPDQSGHLQGRRDDMQAEESSSTNKSMLEGDTLNSNKPAST
eukprot:gene12510-12644_t